MFVLQSVLQTLSHLIAFAGTGTSSHDTILTKEKRLERIGLTVEILYIFLE